MSDSANNDEKMLRKNLFLLELNFFALDSETRRAYGRITPPTLEKIREYAKASGGAIHPLASEMLNAEEAAQQLYAAILLSQIDEKTSSSALEKLKANAEIIKIQNVVGHGSVEVPVRYAAESFQKTGDITKGKIEKIERLEKWSISIAHESRGSDSFLEPVRTPARIFESLKDQGKSDELRREMLELADEEMISKRFYAAVVLEEIDAEAARKILIDLKNSDSVVPFLFGDLMGEIAVSEIAAAYLEKREIRRTDLSTKPPEMTSRIFNSVKKMLFGKN